MTQKLHSLFSKEFKTGTLINILYQFHSFLLLTGTKCDEWKKFWYNHAIGNTQTEKKRSTNTYYRMNSKTIMLSEMSDQRQHTL